MNKNLMGLFAGVLFAMNTAAARAQPILLDFEGLQDLESSSFV